MHLVTLKDWTTAQILEVVDTSSALRQHPDKYAQALAGRTLALLFQKTSTRTRCSGEIGITQLGGHALYLDWRSTNFGLADLGDEIRVLAEYVDFIVARFLRHADVRCAAAVSRVPVMNGCCDRYHPLQILGDLQTIQQTLGRLEGVHLTYVGAHNNVCNSLIAAGLKVGMKVTVATPEPEPATADAELCAAGRRAGLYWATTDLRAALAQSNVVYTDTWIDMEYFLDPAFAAEKDRRLQLYMPYQLNRQLLAGLDLRIMHCLPAHRGYEIEGELLDDPRSIIMAQAQNRLHSQKAVLLKLAGILS